MLAVILASPMLAFADEYIGLLLESPLASVHYTAEIVTKGKGGISRREVYLGPVTIQEAERRVAEELSRVKDGHAYIFSESRESRKLIG